MKTIAQDMFTIRYQEIRRKLLNGKIRDKNLVRTWLHQYGEKVAREAEREVRTTIAPRNKKLLSRQSAFEMAVLADLRDDKDKQ